MTRKMGDSTTAADIPPGMALVAGYVDGLYQWSAADWALHPKATQVRVAVFASTNDGHVLDVETGDATPDQAPSWVTMRRAAGIEPSIYCSEMNGWSAVRQAFFDQGVVEPSYWVANYNGNQAIPPDAVSKQYANQPMTGGHYDLSSVADYWPGVDPPPVPPEEDMPAEFPVVSRDDVRAQVDIPGLNSMPGYAAYALCVRNVVGTDTLTVEAVLSEVPDGKVLWSNNFSLAEAAESDVWLPLGMVGSLVLRFPNKPYAFTLKAANQNLHPDFKP